MIGPLSEGYDVIVPDLRGYGDSGKPDPSDFSLYSLEHGGMGDPVVPSTPSMDIPKYYNNYTMEYVPDGGHCMMSRSPTS